MIDAENITAVSYSRSSYVHMFSLKLKKKKAVSYSEQLSLVSDGLHHDVQMSPTSRRVLPAGYREAQWRPQEMNGFNHV